MGEDITHEIIFRQRRGEDDRSVYLQLQEGFEMFPLNGGEGVWRQKKSGDANPDGIDLTPNFTPQDKKRLLWEWDPDQHGGLLKVGIQAKGASHNGDDVFTKWVFSFRGAKRNANRQFSIATSAKNEGVAYYELGGSSDTFDKGMGEWSVVRYSST